jgi:hypothetical protein
MTECCPLIIFKTICYHDFVFHILIDHHSLLDYPYRFWGDEVKGQGYYNLKCKTGFRLFSWHKLVTKSSYAVSFENIFKPGQAYVAFSRYRKLSGLPLFQFEQSKNHSIQKGKNLNKQTKTEMQLSKSYSVLYRLVTCNTL